MLHRPIENDKLMGTSQPSKPKGLLNLWKVKFFGWLQLLVMPEYTSGSRMPGMALYYAQ